MANTLQVLLLAVLLMVCAAKLNFSEQNWQHSKVVLKATDETVMIPIEVPTPDVNVVIEAYESGIGFFLKVVKKPEYQAENKTLDCSSSLIWDGSVFCLFQLHIDELNLNDAVKMENPRTKRTITQISADHTNPKNAKQIMDSNVLRHKVTMISADYRNPENAEQVITIVTVMFNPPINKVDKTFAETNAVTLKNPIFSTWEKLNYNHKTNIIKSNISWLNEQSKQVYTKLWSADEVNNIFLGAPIICTKFENLRSYLKEIRKTKSGEEYSRI